MEDLSPFKLSGDVQFTLPLKNGFQKTLSELIQATAIKTGFPHAFAVDIARRVCEKLFSLTSGSVDRLPMDAHIALKHRPGQLQIRTEIHLLNFSEEESFSL